MDFSLLWNGILVTVTVPEIGLDTEKERWTWAQTRIAGGTEHEAWTNALSIKYPLSNGITGTSFDACVFGFGVNVDMLQHDETSISHIRTHKVPLHDKEQFGKSGEVNSRAVYTSKIPVAKSTSSLPLFRSKVISRDGSC